MEVGALCVGLSMNVLLLLLLPAQVQNSFSLETDATFPRTVPSRLQLFEYQPLSVNCEGFFDDPTKWRVMRKIRGTPIICSAKLANFGPCVMTVAFPSDSGEYWCETEGKRRSDSVNITVTGGSVILESPVLPVTEGNDVTLRCRSKTTSSSPTAHFSKDGLLIRSSSTGQMTIYSASKSDEGRYKCRISGGGQSAESWLRVTECPNKARPSEHRTTSRHQSCHVYLVLRTVFTILLVALLLLLSVGLHHCGKLKIV